ncbi:MAG: hypothetical protein KC646_07035 [Candidatus Cloacimonetes bacterium]|nr:hypothetical protein [Candidatus Cloacimonadota bacterium]
MNNQANFIKLCDLYYQSQESSILLDENEVLFLNEEQVILYKGSLIISHDKQIQDDIICELEQKKFLKIISNVSSYYVLELNFLKRSKISQTYYTNYLVENFDTKVIDNELYIKQFKIIIDIQRDSSTLTIVAKDKVQKRQIDLPRKMTFLILQTDKSYHYEQSLKQWILLQMKDFKDCDRGENLSQVELLAAILQDLGNLDVQVNQDLDSNHQKSENIQLDINRENQLLIQYLDEIRSIQLPQNLFLINENAKNISALVCLTSVAYDDLIYCTRKKELPNH